MGEVPAGAVLSITRRRRGLFHRHGLAVLHHASQFKLDKHT